MNEKVYSLDYLENVSNGNREFVEQMISLFLKISPPQLKELNESAQSEDFETIKNIIHGMKPSILQLNIDGGESLIEQIELQSKKAEDIEFLSIHISKFSILMETVFSQLEKELE